MVPGWWAFAEECSVGKSQGCGAVVECQYRLDIFQEKLIANTLTGTSQIDGLMSGSGTGT